MKALKKGVGRCNGSHRKTLFPLCGIKKDLAEQMIPRLTLEEWRRIRCQGGGESGSGSSNKIAKG